MEYTHQPWSSPREEGLRSKLSSFLSVRHLNNTQTGEITADQESYIDTLLEQYNMTNCNPNKVPLKTSVNFDEIASRLPTTPDRELVSLYCKLLGELMFVAINTQPLIAHSVKGSGSLYIQCKPRALHLGERRAEIFGRTQNSQTYLVRTACQISISSLRTICVHIPAGRMLFHLAKALKAIWSSVTMLFLV